MKKCPNCKGKNIKYIHNLKTHKNVYKCIDCGYATANEAEVRNTKAVIDEDKKLLLLMHRNRKK